MDTTGSRDHRIDARATYTSVAVALVPTLRAFDAKPSAHVPEPVIVQFLWVLLLWMPPLREELGLPDTSMWDQGGHGRGDLTGWDEGRLIAHVEVKSATANESVGARCHNSCGEHKSQFAHMGEDVAATILTITHTSRVEEVRKMTAEAGVEDRAKVISFRQVADAIDAVLSNGALLHRDLLASLFDVEECGAGLEGPGRAAR